MMKNRTADISTELYFLETNQTEHVDYKTCCKVLNIRGEICISQFSIYYLFSDGN